MTPAAVDVRSEWTEAWTCALGELELEVDRAESLLMAAQPGPPEVSQWAPPTHLGPLPAALLDRAQALHARQLKVTRAIAEALTHNRVQAAVTARLETGHLASRPVYVDHSC